MSGEATDALHRVYAAQGPDDLARAYEGWAASYDRDLAAKGYLLPFVVGAWLARHAAPGGLVLDVGCGTGLSGPCLAALGFRVEGLDFSPAMLAAAAGRGAYARLTRATLGERLPFADGAFDAAVAAGVFTEGHAPASSLREIARAVRPGGVVAVTVRDSVLGPGGFADAFERLAREGAWGAVEQSPPFRAFALAEPEVLVRAWVFRVGAG